MNFDSIIKQNNIKNVRVSFSGGKDSVAVLLWTLNNFKKDKITVYNVHNTLEWSDTVSYIKYLEKELDIKINVVSFSNEEYKKFIYGIEKNTEYIGVPLISRYCQSLAKGKLFDKIPESDVVVEGIRWNESTQRMKETFVERKDNRLILRPLLSWTDIDVYNYIKEHRIKLHWIYKYTDRLGCSMCPLSLLKNKPIVPYIAKKNKDRFNYDFYIWWFDLIVKNGLKRAKGNKTVINNYRKFKKGYDLFKKIDTNKYQLPKRNIPNYGFWE